MSTTMLINDVADKILLALLSDKQVADMREDPSLDKSLSPTENDGIERAMERMPRKVVLDWWEEKLFPLVGTERVILVDRDDPDAGGAIKYLRVGTATTFEWVRALGGAM